jgi:hypothetical protein
VEFKNIEGQSKMQKTYFNSFIEDEKGYEEQEETIDESCQCLGPNVSDKKTNVHEREKTPGDPRRLRC